MPLSWNEIKTRAFKFSNEWAEESSEKSESQTFWNDFFDIFGIKRRRIASFEKRVKRINGQGYIDLIWKGILLVEHKSRGENLDRAYSQAIDYFPGLKENELPRYILVSDFARFRLYDLDEGIQHDFPLIELYRNIQLFGFIAGYQTTSYKESDPVNIEAAQHMGVLHDKLKAVRYDGHKLEVYLVRLLFCLFADNTSIFERHQFRDLIENCTSEDGQNSAHWLQHLFEVLNTPTESRLTNLDEQFISFPYVNGSLFSERLPMASFDNEMRQILLNCCALDWSKISPAIFGALFQSVMDRAEQRNLGAHYTSEKNILKVIKALFLDELHIKFEQIKNNPRKLQEFHNSLAELKFLDPACGCGNFLVIAYRELRLLELDILRVLLKGEVNPSIDVVTFNILCDVDQFFGIEIEEFPAKIAQTALWLMDHQMNLRVSEEFGNYFVRLPLRKSATIIHKNALQIDWCDVVKPAELNYILGNPPFGGKRYQNSQQKQDLLRVFHGVKNAAILDFVAPWYRKAAEYMKHNKTIKTAFVSTNSITQGEQVSILWTDLLQRDVKIHFAHRTFQWSSESPGRAMVHCVIIGFALCDTEKKRLFDYKSPKSEAYEISAKNINPYLVDAPTVVLSKRTKPICGSKSPSIAFGSMPNDGGHLLLSSDERADLLIQEPNALPWIRRLLGSDDLINDRERWCLWLDGISPHELLSMPVIKERVELVRLSRLDSSRKKTRELAATPTIFAEIRQPKSRYLAIPKTSSELRTYIPMKFLDLDTIANSELFTIDGATLYHFGVLSSAMHMAWVRSVCGRLKSDYRYSASIVYNNFPWPQVLTDKPKQNVEVAAQAVLDVRAKHPTCSLAELYNPLTMPPELVKYHRRLDAVVDAVYSKKKFSGDSDRVSLLFELYQLYQIPLISKIKRQRISGS